MLGLDKEVAAVTQQPTAERVKALRRIIPCSTIKSILKQVGQDRHCPRLPKWSRVQKADSATGTVFGST